MPAGPPTPRTGRRTGQRRIVAGIASLALGLGGLGYGITGIMAEVDRIIDAKVSVTGTQTVTLAGGTYTLWSADPAARGCTVSAASGRPVSVEPRGNSSVSSTDRSYRSLAVVTTPGEGAYEFACTGGTVRIVPGSPTDGFGRILGGMMGGVFAIVLGILAIAFGAVARAVAATRSRRRGSLPGQRP